MATAPIHHFGADVQVPLTQNLLAYRLKPVAAPRGNNRPIETVGRELRQMMPFVNPVDIKPGDCFISLIKYGYRY